MASLTSLLQTPQAFPLEQILTQKQSYINKLIDYISVTPDPFLMNQRQCYYYPLKSLQILNGVSIYKLIIKKQAKTVKVIDVTKQQVIQDPDSDKQYQYPYLERLFKNIKAIESQEILLGYVDRFLFSITKKTPEIYEFFKDNPNALVEILKNDKILFALKQFLVLFLTQSTMMLYVFLKNMILRTLMFRIVQNQDTGPMVYQTLCDFYTELLKTYAVLANQQDKEEILQVLKNIEQQNFIALLALKISPQHHRRTYFIAKILNQIAGSPHQVTGLVTPYVDSYTQYLELYEQSQDFMLLIMPDQLMMLRLIIKVCSITFEGLSDVKEELIKRLLVYCNIHDKNTILHNMLYTLIQILYEQENLKLLSKAKIVEFLRNNLNETASINFKSLVKRVCLFYVSKELDASLQVQQEKEFVKKIAKERAQRLADSIYFGSAKKQSQISCIQTQKQTQQGKNEQIQGENSELNLQQKEQTVLTQSK